MRKQSLAQKFRKVLLPVVRGASYKHDPLLINSLAAFNFRPAMMLEFPGERLVRRGVF